MLPTPDIHQLPRVYDRTQHPALGNVDGLLFKDGQFAQSAELNELQQHLHQRLDGVANAVFTDGDVVEGGAPVIVTDDPDLNLRILAGKVYIKGKVYDCSQAEFTIPMDQMVSVGVRVVHTILAPEDNEVLLNPAIGTVGYNEPGAYRAASSAQWSWRTDSDSDSEEGEFYHIYNIDNGTPVLINFDGMSDIVRTAIARYDNDAHGSYVADGLQVQFDEDTGPDHVFKVAAGTAHLRGFLIEREADSVLTYEKDPDERTALNEPHVFLPSGSGGPGGSMNLILNRSPLASVGAIVGTKEKTVTVVKGAANTSDVIDPLVSSVLSIVEVKQGGTTYVAGADYTQSGDDISWAPGGSEPADASSYTVKFRYLDTDVDSILVAGVDYIVVSGYVVGTTLLVTYNYKLPRVDLIVIKGDGTLDRVKGVPALLNPVAPIAGANELPLATVEYNWIGSPKIRNIAVRAVHMSGIAEMRSNIFTLFRLAAEEKLRNDANQKDPVSKISLFVDSFVDDSQRDRVLAQSGACVNRFLTLPVEVTPHEFVSANAAKELLLPFEPVVALQQPRATRSHVVNPFKTSGQNTAYMILSPDSDAWALFDSPFASRLTELFIRSSIASRLGDSEASKVRRDKQLSVSESGAKALNDDLAESIERLENGVANLTVRERTVKMSIRGFRPGESITEAKFDKKDIPELIGLICDDDGNITADFVIPSGVKAGMKSVFVRGSRNTTSEAVYRASFDVLPWQRRRRFGPIAQSFLPSYDMMVCAIDIKLDERGPTRSPIYVQLREMRNGIPSDKCLAEGIIQGGAMSLNRHSQKYISNFFKGGGISLSAPNTRQAPNDVPVRKSAGEDKRAMVFFNLPSNLNVGAAVFSASLYVREKAGSANVPLVVRRVIQENFDGDEVTWNDRDDGVAWSVGGGNLSTHVSPVVRSTGQNKEWLEFDITNMVRTMADLDGTNDHQNRGFAILCETDGAGTANLNLTTAEIEVHYRPIGYEKLESRWLRANFDVPVFVRGGTSYCFTLLTADRWHKVNATSVGDDMNAEQNDGAIGVVGANTNAGSLLVSSDGISWKVKPKMDLTYRVIRCEFTATEQSYPLGTVVVDDMTDFMLRPSLDRFTANTIADFDVTYPGGSLEAVDPFETVAIGNRVDGNVTVTAKLKGTQFVSPIIHPQPAFLSGDTKNIGDYITKLVKSSDTFDATVILRAHLPSGSSIVVQVTDAAYSGPDRVIVLGEHQFTWETMTLDEEEVIEGGYVERIYKLPGVRGVTYGNYSQVKVILNGTPTARPLVKDLQFYVI
jgi:hypothetical protein